MSKNTKHNGRVTTAIEANATEVHEEEPQAEPKEKGRLRKHLPTRLDLAYVGHRTRDAVVVSAKTTARHTKATAKTLAHPVTVGAKKVAQPVATSAKKGAKKVAATYKDNLS